MNAAQVGALIRHLFGALGAFAVANGYLTEDQLLEIAGGFAVIGSFVWSFWIKKETH